MGNQTVDWETGCGPQASFLCTVYDTFKTNLVYILAFGMILQLYYLVLCAVLRSQGYDVSWRNFIDCASSSNDYRRSGNRVGDFKEAGTMDVERWGEVVEGPVIRCLTCGALRAWRDMLL